MTANQISYWNLMENSRANREKEAENIRSNKAKEYENLRHNLQTEDVARREVTEKEKTGRVNRPMTIITGATRSLKDVTDSVSNITDTIHSFSKPISTATKTRAYSALPNEYVY